MESIRSPNSVVCERAVLCDVQNERSALQQQHTSSRVRVCEVHSDQKENVCRSLVMSSSNTDVYTPDPDITFKSFTCPGGEVEIPHGSVLINPHSPLRLKNTRQDEHQDHTYSTYSTSDRNHLTSADQSLSHTRSTDITFTCPTGGDQITAVICEMMMHSQISHPYSQRAEQEEVEEEEGGSVNHVSISDSKSAADVTYKSFTCPGGEVEITDESFSESDMKNDSLAANDSQVNDPQSETCHEYSELPTLHFDHPYCYTQASELGSKSEEAEEEAGGGSICHPSISKNVTFKSYTCLGGDEITEESLIKNDSLVPDESLVKNQCESLVKSESLMQNESLPKDSEVCDLHPDDHADLHSHKETLPCVLSPVDDPEGVTAVNDSHCAVNVSTAAERRDDITGTDVEMENRVSMLIKSLNIYTQTTSSPESGESVLESAVRCEEAENRKSEMNIDISSSDRTVKDLAQHETANAEERPQNLRNLGSPEKSEVSHSPPGAIGLSENFITTETHDLENHDQTVNDASRSTGVDPEIPRSESVAMETRERMWSHMVLSEPSTPKQSALWIPESPIPPPQLHSTLLTTPLTQKPTPLPTPMPVPSPASQHQPPKVMKDLCTVGQGPLQEQLRKMGELLIVASGKISAPVAVTPVQQHSACVWTTPTQQQERSTNTSAIMVERKESSVSDACTATDSLLWSMSRSNLESLSRSELEQKMISTLIMVEVLSQQLTSTQGQNLQGRTGPGPSSLRDRLVQTDQTELSQTGPYRELYVNALEKIRCLEIDKDICHRLHQAMQLMSVTMVRVRSEMEEALSSMKEFEGVVTDDQEIHSQQLGQMKALIARCMDTLSKMEEKNRVCVKDRDHMKQQMDEALEEKSTVLRVLEHLRVHHSAQVSDLQRNLGSHEELITALSHTHPQLVELNKLHMDSMSEANALLKQTLEDHTHLSAELCKAQQLLQRTFPLLHKLHHKALVSIQHSNKHQQEKEQALEDREQMEQQLHEALCGLQEARQQIADLNTQITIMTSEMGVLREQLTEAEDERCQLQRKTTELSATVSSSLASYAFLEQALASETSKLQRSLHNTQEATDRADSLQEVLSVCERRVEELEQMMIQRESVISELSAETENQRLQLHRLTQVQTELSIAKEMSEFLQAENELNREQLTESEGLLRSHLQGLRERNLECEDLRVELQQLRVEKECLQKELVSTRDKARLMLLDQGEQLAQATLDTSLLLQRVCALLEDTHTTDNKSTGGTVQSDPSPLPQICSSFLNSVINALTEEQPCVTAPPTDTESCVEKQDPIENMGSRSSAFTRITPADIKNTDDETHSTTLLALLSSLGESVSDLRSAIEQQKRDKDSEIQTLHNNIRDLQKEMEVQNNRNTVERVELIRQVGRLKGHVEKDAQVLQQKTQDEKALKKLCSELEEKMEAGQKVRAENSDLRREASNLRCALQQSQVEVQALRAELNSTDQSAASMSDLDNRIRLLREVEKLKASLMEAEESRSKLLERAKRHQMVHSLNQSKLERELHLLDDMIETVRKALSSVPDVVNSCAELQKLVEYLG